MAENRDDELVQNSLLNEKVSKKEDNFSQIERYDAGVLL